MDLVTEKVHDVVVLELGVEELDASNVPDFKRQMGPILEAHAKVVIDLTRTLFIDSSGIGAFLSCLRKVNERGGELKLCGLSKTVQGVFELVRMQRVFDILPTREAAVRAFPRLRESIAPSASA